MNAEVVVALIAAGVALATPLVTWFLNRQNNADLRLNTHRDLETLRSITPASDTARLVEWNIHQNMQTATMRDQRRSHINRGILSVGQLVAVTVVVTAFSITVPETVPPWFSISLEIASSVLAATAGARFAYVTVLWRRRAAEIEAMDFWHSAATTKHEDEDPSC